jgi:trehalose 6-phosphate synthase/phosphatase
VAWTGEIQVAPELDAQHAGSQPDATRTKASAPIPVNTQAATESRHSGIHLDNDDRARLEKQIRHGKYGHAVPVWMEGNEDLYKCDQARWRQYAENEIYALFHYKQHEPMDGMEERKWWANYLQLNLAFADRIMQVYKPGDVIWIHDFQLLLLPTLLRQRMTNMYIGFFLHVPFPSSELVRCLSRRKELLEGMLGANMIGFQSYSYSRHFASACTRILDFESDSASVNSYGRIVPFDVFPIGIDAKGAEAFAFGEPEIEEKMKTMRRLYAGKKIIVGRDRLDSVRGVVQKLESFEIFLERYPEWRGRVVLIQVTSPTTNDSITEVKIQNKVSELVSHINGLYGSLSFSPVQHYPQYLPKSDYVALLRVADVGLITTVRDGMNTTALEYIICQKENHGPLIISEFSGTASTLSDAFLINPWDSLGVAAAINRALLETPEKRKAIHERLYRQVTGNTVEDWTGKFLKRLLTTLTSNAQSAATPALDRQLLQKQFKAAKRRLFMFDYDGTLTPIVRDPQAAIPTDRILRNLKMLASDPKNSVWIISGRDQNFLNQWMGDISELGLSAEHGSFIRQPGMDEWENLAEKLDMGWQKEVLETFQFYTEKTQGM